VIGDAEALPRAATIAEQLGKALAEAGYTVVTGGRGGIMQAASKGAYEAGGDVVGILPGTDLEMSNAYCTVVLPTGQGHGRNHTNVLAGDAVVVIGGKAGTLSELSFAWLYDKPIAALTGYGGVADQYGGKPLDSRKGPAIAAFDSVASLMDWLGEVFSH
ncbi:MAG TPA: TIGR00725 family protein, partial [Cytophagales bacterium]|nr:TIGR00725 family protein [Cytophagales bacterium]HAA21958.1 TIGR00725 family protein [Cytophagales bacterium]